MTTPILNRDEFRAWLEAHTQEIVGIALDDCKCPLAAFLQTAKHESTARVEDDWYRLNKQRYPLPDWAQMFVHMIDSKYLNYLDSGDNDNDDTYYQNIWGAQALAVLDSIEQS